MASADELGGDYFNDLSQRPSNGSESHSRSSDGSRAQQSTRSPDEVPKSKKVSCMVCRKRKLRCDGAKPKCGNCVRLKHECGYEEQRKKSGPKRGYVKRLEARISTMAIASHH